MIERNSDRCLVVGRTHLDVNQCISFGHPTHPPAPTSFVWDDYENFDGDIITAHTLKFGAICACAAEASPRVQAEAINNPGKVVFGTTFHHRHYHFSDEFNEAAVVLYNGEYTKKMPEGVEIMNYLSFGQSGMFSVWFALCMGYKEVYTIGIDANSIEFPEGMQYDRHTCQEFVDAYVSGRCPEGDASKLSFQPGKQQGIDAALIYKESFPEQRIYKVSDLSRMPFEVKLPPTKGVKND